MRRESCDWGNSPDAACENRKREAEGHADRREQGGEEYSRRTLAHAPLT